jgi:hypothetical protein
MEVSYHGVLALEKLNLERSVGHQVPRYVSEHSPK